MKRIYLLQLILLFLVAFAGKTVGQNLFCNDLLYVSLNENCSHTLLPSEMLEGIIYDNCIVEIDKVLPLGNGPWVAANLGPADVGKTYQARVRHLPSGNMCWGNVKIEDKLPPQLDCSGISVVTLPTASNFNVPSAALNVVYSDNCSSQTIAPNLFSFDCNNEGVNVVQLTASDAYGNTATCLHSVMVIPAPACMTCVTTCPSSVTVSFDEGNYNLLPAVQNNNLGVLDSYGNSLFDTGCGVLLDSVYTVTYHAGTGGYDWLERQWLWVSDTQFGTCKQYITFPNTHTVTVQGQVFLDSDDDCVADAGEQPISKFPLVVTLSSGSVNTFYPDASGHYSTQIQFGSADGDAQLHLLLPSGVNTVCPNALIVPNSTATPSQQFDIGLQSQGNCPQMQVDLGNLFTRRCATNYFRFNYCNNGLDTAYGAFVKLDLDSLITILEADLPYTIEGPDSVYIFQLGDVPPFFCGSVLVKGFVNCGAVPGSTVCNTVEIFPDTTCAGAWGGARLEAAAHCEGDSVRLTIKNTGALDMGADLDYIVVEDFIMYKEAAFHLTAGDSITIKTEANGATWRIESPQVSGFPGGGLVAAALEGCGGINTPGVINRFAQGDNSRTFDEECSEVVASCDPNDKTAVPIGFSDEHFIRANQPIEYKIRFQNTGTDTAFRVVIVDTLSSMLDVRSLETGVSSHTYRLEVYDGGIIRFIFDPIVLPDSNANEVESHGYVSFRIAQQPDLPDGALIENRAGIYFDYNDVVLTNTAFHTIGYPFISNPPLKYDTQTTAPSCHGSVDGGILVAVSGGVPPYTYAWSDPALQGESPTGLAAGIYYVTVHDSYRSEAVITIELLEPDPIALTTNATAATGIDANGTANVTVTGGTEPYKYEWSNGATTQSIDNAVTGVYGVTVTDANWCTQSGTVTVPQIILPLTYSSGVTNLHCFGSADGAISLTLAGGLPPYAYQWSEPGLQGASVSGLAAGAYQVTLSDSNGSQLELSFELTQPGAIVLATTFTTTSPTINNGMASTFATGGTAPYSYLWSNGATTATISGLGAGTYTVTVTDANGCTQTDSGEVTEITLPLIATAQVTNISCNGLTDGAIQLTTTGGVPPYTYEWSEPGLQGSSLSGLPAGIYAVTITDSQGTTIEETILLTEPAPVLISLSSTNTSGGQNNGSATAISSAPNTSYVWSNGATTATITDLAAGTYTVTITDQNGCTAIGTVEVQPSVSSHEPGAIAIRVWPNPAHDQIRVDLEKALPGLVCLDLLAADGRLLTRVQAEDLQPQLTLRIPAETATGFVLLALHREDGSVHLEKIVVK